MAGDPSKRVLVQVHRLFHLGAVGAMSDAQLLDRFVSGRDEAAEAAFEELVIRHAPMVLQVCRNALHDAHDAEDAFQGTFLVLASRAGSIRRAGSIASWLCGVARRVAARTRRGAARRRALDRRVAERTPEAYFPSPDAPDQEALHQEIGALPERLRAPIVLCYLQGMNYEVAARQLGLSETAIRGRLARARERLRHRLTRRGVTVPAGLLVAGAAAQAQTAAPSALIHSTIRIATGFVAGHTANALARGVLNAMLLNRLRIATVLLCLTLGGSFWAWRFLVAADDGKGRTNPSPKVQTVQLISPAVRNIAGAFGQPSFIEAYERTPICPRVTAYINNWHVDIGDKVRKNQVLATLFAPELVEDHQTKIATVALDRERIELAQQGVKAAMGHVKAAEARLMAARSILDRDEARVHRRDSEFKRLKQEVDRGGVDGKVLSDARDQLASSIAERESGKAAIEEADAELLTERAALERAKLDVRVAKAELKVAESDARRVAAWVDYLTLRAPFDGVIVARNANTFDLVQPAQGATPIYVVDRTDIIRVFVDIPERFANEVQVGGKCTVLARAYRDEPIPGTVTRTAWALNVKSRALRVEIDLPNPGGRLLPGMYAFAKLYIERAGARALPTAAVTSIDGMSYCWTYDNGRAAKTEIETGVCDGRWIEVIRRRAGGAAAATKDEAPWTPIDGSERVILGDLPALRDGAPVQVAPASRGPDSHPSDPPAPAETGR
jgi:HlyD family secretion protein